MWSCSEFAQHLDASCAQKGLWQNHIQPQMQRIVQYSLACATVSQPHLAQTSHTLRAVPVRWMMSCNLLRSKLPCKDPSRMPARRLSLCQTFLQLNYYNSV